MGKIWAFLFLVLFFSPVLAAVPSKYTDYSVDIVVREDRRINETIIISFPENMDYFSYYLLHPIPYLKVFGNGKEINCTWEREVDGVQVDCANFSASKISMEFEYAGLIKENDGVFILSDRYIFSTPTDKFSLKVTFPQGYFVSEKEVVIGGQNVTAYYPKDAIQETDGRRISVKWTRQPRTAEVFSFGVAYEKISAGGESNWLLIIILGVILIVLAIIYFRQKPTLKEYGLNEDERKILDVLLKENKVPQKKIVRETGFSKAHVSRIAKRLEERGIIERNKRGRSYEVVLKK